MPKVVFCARFVEQRSPLVDQMVQAALRAPSWMKKSPRGGTRTRTAV